MNISTCTNFYLNLVFLVLGVVDLVRRLYFMKTLDTNLETNRFKINGYYKLLPLLNFFDPKSLISWMNMRLLLNDIGYRFYLRIQLYYSVYILAYTCIIGTYLLHFFELISLNIPADLFVVCAFESFLCLILFYRMFSCAAKINEEASN